jgi:hypothetical protein
MLLGAGVTPARTIFLKQSGAHYVATDNMGKKKGSFLITFRAN